MGRNRPHRLILFRQSPLRLEKRRFERRNAPAFRIERGSPGRRTLGSVLKLSLRIFPWEDGVIPLAVELVSYDIQSRHFSDRDFHAGWIFRLIQHATDTRTASADADLPDAAFNASPGGDARQTCRTAKRLTRARRDPERQTFAMDKNAAIVRDCSLRGFPYAKTRAEPRCLSAVVGALYPRISAVSKVGLNFPGHANNSAKIRSGELSTNLMLAFICSSSVNPPTN
jgi:hypothetical protein